MSEGESQPSIRRLAKAGLNMLRTSGHDAYQDPEAYDHFVNKYLGRDKLVKDLADQIQKLVAIEKGTAPKILDEAAGTGALTLELAKRGYDISATDISSDMLTRLQEKTVVNGVTIATALADLNGELPYPDNNFDVVTTASSNRYITDLNVFLDEAHRVLRENGFLVWTVLPADIIPWKRHAGFKQPTFSFSLAKEMEKHGFKNVKKNTIGPLIRNIGRRVPAHAIPTYLIGQK